MYSEKHSFHVSNPEPPRPFSRITMEANQEIQMTIRKKIQAAMIWISDRLPYARPQFQIFYSEESDSQEEE